MACYTPYGIISSGQCQYKSEAKVPFHQFLSTYRHIRLCNHVIHNLFFSSVQEVLSNARLHF